jgi:hypothetical protein
MKRFPVKDGVLWTLKLHGDVEDDAGNATAVLLQLMNKRAAATGHALLTNKQVSNSVFYLQGVGAVEVDRNPTRHATRIVLVKDDLPADPFELPVVHDLQVVDTSKTKQTDILGPIAEWPISKRLAFMKALAESIERDHNAYKLAVTEGL